jgi:hypothetical protein
VHAKTIHRCLASCLALLATPALALSGACYRMQADQNAVAPDGGGDGGDTDSDSSVDTGPACEGSGVWHDEVSGHCWENPAPGGLTDGWGASNYCEELELDGHSDWQLPDVDALRSLIPCEGCVGDGPGNDGCYWPGAVGGPCGVHYWSSSWLPENSTFVWYVDYENASVGFVHKENVGYVRCIRAAD